MKSKHVRKALVELIESDRDGFGRLPALMSKKDWRSCLSDAASFLSKKLSNANVPDGMVLISKSEHEELLDKEERYAAAANFAPAQFRAHCGHYVCDGFICMTCGADPTQDKEGRHG